MLKTSYNNENYFIYTRLMMKATYLIIIQRNVSVSGIFAGYDGSFTNS